MIVPFSKYQGAGNDFIMIDGFQCKDYKKLTEPNILKMCDRNFGIGADGLIILIASDSSDFEMLYFNSDGKPSTMCGNGGRCAVAFAKKIGLIENSTIFLAVDGPHEASISGGQVSLGMKDVSDIKTHETFYKLDTGSPHYVSFVEDLEDINVKQEGALIRNSPLFEEEGINVNFVQELAEDQLFVRTYERGVEDETLSCGTGVTACSLVQMLRTQKKEIRVKTLGGELSVKAKQESIFFTEVKLIGPATYVFTGQFEINA
jgi:diaminopimelate epimerase